MAQTTRQFHQNFFDEDIEPMTATTVKLSELTEDILKPFLDINPYDPIGIAPAYAESSNQLVVLAIANASQILLVELYSKMNASRGNFVPSKKLKSPGHNLLQEKLLLRPTGSIFAFNFEPLALSLYKDHGGLRLINGVDIQSACSPEDRDRLPLESIKRAIGDDTTIYEENIKDSFENMIYDPKRTPEIALRAWVSQYLPRLGSMEGIFAAAKRIDTQKIPGVTLDLLAKTSRDGQRLDQEKPTHTRKNVVTRWDDQNNRMVAKVDRYQNKMRASQQQRVRVNVGSDTSAGYTLPGAVASAEGRNADLEVHGLEGNYHVGKVVGTIDIKGREDATNSEKKRGQVILGVLQGDGSVLDSNVWVKKLYFPAEECVWPPAFSTAENGSEPDFTTLPRLPNPSQLHAVKQMLSSSEESRLVVIQGPPGTGKTTVIASYVLLAIARGDKGLWLTAQSNVAVRNIAEKLNDIDFPSWKLLVSRDFFLDWHEHLYPHMRSHVIVSNEMTPNNLRRELTGCSVILCTLSMLSSNSIGKVVKYNPLTTLVIDEASQIEIGDYMAVLTNPHFATSLRKICFIGDDKQLPPFANDSIETLQSIFEVEHLRGSALFLNTQYRMPPFIGDFISKSVYDGKLASNPDHIVKNKTISCYFIDVTGGKQKSESTNMSLKNLAELEVVLQIATQLQKQEKSYRFITPYDAMRTAVELAMRESGLDWADKCFNVDSFQGNEDDYIIISTVRSSDLGFLKSKRRTNVMLTRCKRGMFICSSRAYLEGDGSGSLVGEMAAEFGERSWVSTADLEQVLTDL